MIINHGRMAGLALASIGMLSLAACNSSGSYRVASVGTNIPGDTAGDGSGGTGDTGGGTGGGGGATGGGTGAGTGNGTGTGSGTGNGGALGGNLLAASGNAVIGVANTQAGLTAGLGIPATGLVTGTVNRVLTATGQTLVGLGNGSTLILDGKGGALGSLVSIDLGQGKVIGGSSGASPLIGLNVLARNPSTGQLATVSAASGGNLVSVTVPNGQGGNLLNVSVPGVVGSTNGATGATGGLLSGVTQTTGGLLGGATGATGASANVNGTLGSTLGTVNATVNGVLNPQGASAGANANTNLLTGTTNAVGGVVNTLLTPTKPR